MKGWVGRKVGGLGGSGKIKIKDNLGQAKNQVSFKVPIHLIVILMANSNLVDSISDWLVGLKIETLTGGFLQVDLIFTC